MTTEAQRVMAAAMSEDDLLTSVIDEAHRLSWRVVHFRPAKTKKGWRTAVQGDGEGFPDLLLLRGKRGIAAELKSMKGRITSEQAGWLLDFEVTGWRTYVWRPADWVSRRIAEVLQ